MKGCSIVDLYNDKVVRILKREYTVRSLQLYTYHEGSAELKVRTFENFNLQTGNYIHARYTIEERVRLNQ